MKLGDATREYVASKQATGMVFTAEAYVLRTFTEKLRPNIPIKKVTSDSVLDYLNGHGPVTLFWHRKHDALSGFWRFAIQHGYTDRCSRARAPTPETDTLHPLHLHSRRTQTPARRSDQLSEEVVQA